MLVVDCHTNRHRRRTVGDRTTTKYPGISFAPGTDNRAPVADMSLSMPLIAGDPSSNPRVTM
jgi:hypothetical protein